MIDVELETLVPLTEAPDHLPSRRGKKVHRATIFRWALKGLRGHRLDTVKIGGSRFTSAEALRRFIRGCNQPPTPKGISICPVANLSSGSASEIDARVRTILLGEKRVKVP